MRSIILFCALLSQDVLGDLLVQLPNGKVRGTTIDTPSSKTFYAWRGIPYGKAPVGELRYLPPVKVEPWHNIIDASKDSPACIFFASSVGEPTPINGNSEDCLYINVYSPVQVGSNSSVDPTLPVLVWIYGGGFISGFSGFGSFDPTPFLEENVMVVSFNYRLGAFGFVSTGDDVILGNAGLKDQNLALQWIQENIAFFGGSPKDITIFGGSAGGISVGYHVVSPKSRNLFKGAIMESGSALINTIQSNPKSLAIKLASQIDSSITNTSTSEEIRKVLQAASVEEVVMQYKKISSEIRGPVIEVNNNQSFLTDLLYEALESGHISKVPVIIGYNSEEALAFSGSDVASIQQRAVLYDSSQELMVPNMPLKANVSSLAIGKEVHEHYVGKDGLFADNLATFLEWSSDNTFIRSSTKQAILHSKFSPVYMYQFSFFGSVSKDNPIVPGAGKVSHGQELPYLFNISTSPLKTEADFLTRRRFVKLWTNFAKTSNPTPDDDSAELLQNVKWDPITADDVTYLDIDDNLQVKPSRKVDETSFWDYLWKTYAIRPYNTY